MPIFNAGDSLGSMQGSDIAEYLTDIGDLESAKLYVAGSVQGQMFGLPVQPHMHTGLVLGFIAPDSSGRTAAVLPVSDIGGDNALISTRIKISLDKFYVHSFPGGGEHNILCEFSGSNQVAKEAEPLRFALRFKARDKDSASMSGVPLFLGVTVGKDGISFEGRTINVSSTSDEALLATLESPAFKSGLSLLQTAQPALKPFTTLAEAAVKNVLNRSKNKQVHHFNLGLDFGTGTTSARLRLGSYVVVQTNAANNWDWSALEWSRESMALRYRDGTRQVEFNYMIFGVTQFAGDAA